MASENREEKILIGHFSDQANLCYNRNIPVFSAFLNLNEQDILERNRSSYPSVVLKTSGGYDLAERKLAVFLPENDFPYELPVSVLKISQVDKRFSQSLNHRDFLGAIMNLGIDRSLIGDICISNGVAYCFCLNKIAEYIIENLTKVRNDFVIVEKCDISDDTFAPQYQEIVGSVQSVRLDSLVSLAFNESRSHSVNYIQDALTFVNGKLITTNAYNLKENDIISVRKKGRFKYIGIRNESKKGRYFVILHKYI